MGIGIGKLLLIFGIILLLFGTKKLANLGGDLGSALRGFKNAMKDGQEPEPHEEMEKKRGVITENSVIEGSVIEGQSKKEESH